MSAIGAGPLSGVVSGHPLFPGNAGAGQASVGVSFRTFFGFTGALLGLFLVQIGIFLVMKRKFPNIYQPQSSTVPVGEGPAASPKGYWDWVKPIFRTSDTETIEKGGLDAYFFLRYFLTVLKLFVPLSIVTLPVLLPLNFIDGRGPAFVVGKYARNTALYSNVTGLDRLGWSNVRPEQNSRYWAHLGVALFVVVYACYIFFVEFRAYTNKRQTYLSSAEHRIHPSATTVLVSGIPLHQCTSASLTKIYGIFPGGVRKVWVNRNFEKLQKKVESRTKIAHQLEEALTALIRNAKKAHLQKAGAQPGPNNASMPVWKRYVKEKDRETKRLSFYGPSWMHLGPKVDTIDSCRKELARLNAEIEHDQNVPEEYALTGSAFVRFNRQMAAHMACQTLSHCAPCKMTPRVVELSPKDVIWDTLSINQWQSYLRTCLAIVFFVGLIICWFLLVTLASGLSQIEYLIKEYQWLQWLGKAPMWAIKLTQSLGVTMLVAVFVFLPPFVLRRVSKFQGNHTGMAVERSLQNYLFAFNFFQSVIVVGSTSLVPTLGEIVKDAQLLPSVLASNLPKASNFLFTILMSQGLVSSAGVLLQSETLWSRFVLGPLRDRTARNKWDKQGSLPDISWGVAYPNVTNLAVIGLIYSVITPLITIFVIITFGLLWFGQRYNVLNVYKIKYDAGGLLYPRAINQLFTGLYVMELCLIGLFFLVRDSDDEGRAIGRPCKGQAIIMILALIATIIYQVLLNRTFSPLFKYLPLVIESRDNLNPETLNPVITLTNDIIADLAPREGDGDAYVHEAMRAKPPVIWIPRDELGVSDDEIRRTQQLRGLLISNDNATLDAKCRVVCSAGPPE